MAPKDGSKAMVGGVNQSVTNSLALANRGGLIEGPPWQELLSNS